MAEKKTTTYARNPEQLARALGLNLSPRKRKKALAMVAELLGETGFPKKTGKGWVVAEVLVWIDQAGKHPTSNIQHPTSNGGKGKGLDRINGIKQNSLTGKNANQANDLPIAAKPAAEGDLFATPAEQLERLLDLYQHMLFFPEKYLETKIAVWQVKMLQEKRPGLFESDSAKKQAGAVAEASEDEGTGPEQEMDYRNARSQKVLSERLTRIFQGRLIIPPSQTHISQWKNNELPDPMIPLPPQIINNEHPTRAWVKWIETYILPLPGWGVGAGGNQVMFSLATEARNARDREDIDNARRARVEADDAERRLSNKWIETDVAEALGGGWARQYHGFWRNAIEKRSAERYGSRLKEIGVTEGQAGLLMDFWVEERRDELGLVERQCEAAAAEYKKLVAEEAGRKGLTANGH